MERVGIRELRANLASLLDRASRGEELLVTDRGKPVARIGPVDKDELILQRLAAEGRVRRARRPRRLLAQPLEVAGSPLSSTLRELKGR